MTTEIKKLPNVLNTEDKETLGKKPDQNPKNGLEILKRAAKSGLFTVANQHERKK